MQLDLSRSVRIRSSAMLAALLLTAVWLSMFRGPAAANSGTLASVASGLAGASDDGDPLRLDPARVMGHQSCVKCHKLEVLAWMKTKHHGSTGKLDPTNANVQKYAAALGIQPANVQRDSACALCHGTPQANEAGQVRVVAGVSCESCHGASGGEEGWLNRHAVYGPNIARRKQETPEHRQARLEYCEQAGMIRAADLHKLARNCLGCHLVGNEKLVAAGHPDGSAGFELVSWSAGEVRHNFHADVQTDDTRNAPAPRLWMETTGDTPEQRRRIKFVVGVLADLEQSLRLRAAAKDPAFIAKLGGRIGGLNGKLAQITGGAPAAAAQIAPLQGVIGGAFARLFSPMNDDQKYYTDAADKVSEAARQFTQTHDGAQLGGLDATINSMPPKGTVYQP